MYLQCANQKMYNLQFPQKYEKGSLRSLNLVDLGLLCNALEEEKRSFWQSVSTSYGIPGQNDLFRCKYCCGNSRIEGSMDENAFHTK